jgi:hypothetical protein
VGSREPPPGREKDMNEIVSFAGAGLRVSRKKGTGK